MKNKDRLDLSDFICDRSLPKGYEISICLEYYGSRCSLVECRRILKMLNKKLDLIEVFLNEKRN